MFALFTTYIVSNANVTFDHRNCTFSWEDSK